MVPLTSSLCSCPPAPRHPVPPWLAEVWHTLGHIPWSTSPAVSHQNHLILWHRVHSGHRNLSRVGGGISQPASSLAQTHGAKPAESSYSWSTLGKSQDSGLGTSQQGGCPRVKAALLGCAVVAPTCSVPCCRAIPKSRSLWLAQHQDSPCASRWQLLFRDLSLCWVWHILVRGTALQLPCLLWPRGSLGCVGTHGAEVWYLAVTRCVQRCGLCSCSMAWLHKQRDLWWDQV